MATTGYSSRTPALRWLFGRGVAVALPILFALLALQPAALYAMGAKHKAVAPVKGVTLVKGYAVIGGFSMPESVASDGKHFYVSNVGRLLAPSVKDGDGFISLLTPDGAVVNREFITGLDAPKGMGIVEGVLYVTDIDRVAGFDLKSGKEVFSLDFSAEKTRFLNDIAVVDSTTLLVSATDIGKVYAVTLGEHKRYTPVVVGIEGVNGLEFDSVNRRLFIVNFIDGGKDAGKGRLSVMSFAHGPGELKDLTGRVGMLDGVALLPGGRVLFSDWVEFGLPGRLLLFDIESGELSNVELKAVSIGPADLFYDRAAGRIWLPGMVDGEVLIQDYR